MKNNFKYLFLSLFILLVFPLVTNAASITLEGSKDKNVATYEVKYDPTDATEEQESINVNINKTNDDLTYTIKKGENELILGECKDNLSCTLNVKELKSITTLATITITNTSNESKETTISVSGTYPGAEKTFTLSGMPTTTTTTTTTTQAIIPNNNLSGLTVSNGVMDKTFSKDVTEYNVTEIRDTVPTVTIKPTCETECDWNITCPLGECSVKNPTDNATVTLQTGANKVSIVVTSKDKSINKTYIVNVYRGEIKTSSAYLSDIKLTDVELSPKFDSMTNDYTTTVGMDIDSLDITTIAEDPEANIVIKGNENFKEGENTVTITVTSSDGENKQVYTIIVTKEEIEEETEEEKKEVNTVKVEKKKKNNTLLIILLSVLVVLIIATVFIILFIKKKKKNDKNDKNNKGNGTKARSTEKDLDDVLQEENTIEKENTESLNILNETRRLMNDEPKQDIDEALDDLMKTKRLELGDLGL